MSPVAKSVEAPASNRFESFGSKTSSRIEMQCIWPFGHESRSVVRCPSACLDLSHDSRLRSYARAQQFTGNGNYPLAERTSWTTQTACAMVWRYDSTCDQAKAEERNLSVWKAYCLRFDVSAVGAGYDQVPIHLGYFQQHFGVYGTGIWPWLTHSHTIFFSSGTCRRLKRWSATFRPSLPLMGILSWYWLHVYLARLWGSYHSEALMQQLAASACETWNLRVDPKPQWSWFILIHDLFQHGQHDQHGSEGNKRVSHTTQPQARDVRITDIPRTVVLDLVLCESLLVFGFCRAIQIRLPHCYKLREHTFQIVLRFCQQLAVCEM